MAWRLAKGLEKLRSQVNERWPNRSKESDGSIGNAEHSARSSDHNPDTDGVVKAIDLTHDPKSGLDSYVLAEALRADRDPRIKYIISNRKIASGDAGPSPWIWRKYTGSNPHNHHVHISIKADKAHFDSIDPWNLDGMDGVKPVPDAPAPPPTLRKGSKGKDVAYLQALLNKHGASLKADEDFGQKTKDAVIAFQQTHGLVADGVVGSHTWDVLKGAV